MPDKNLGKTLEKIPEKTLDKILDLEMTGIRVLNQKRGDLKNQIQRVWVINENLRSPDFQMPMAQENRKNHPQRLNYAPPAKKKPQEGVLQVSLTKTGEIRQLAE